MLVILMCLCTLLMVQGSPYIREALHGDIVGFNNFNGHNSDGSVAAADQINGATGGAWSSRSYTDTDTDNDTSSAEPNPNPPDSETSTAAADSAEK